MSYFDTDNDGHVNFDEFLVGVRVSLLSTLADLADLFFRAR